MERASNEFRVDLHTCNLLEIPASIGIAVSANSGQPV